MSELQSTPQIYTVGGTVQASGGRYISRHADDELLALCRALNFAYVLTPRQMGKSSLMVNTAERLNEEGIRSVIIDLTEIGVNVTADKWYLGLLAAIEDKLMLDTDVVQWWDEHERIGTTQRLTLFFEEVLLKEITEKIVIFVDEIDTTLSLNFTDDFYAAIRFFYNARAHTPSFQRMSFVLIGVATPGDLIRNPQRTPFNVGQRVDLTDFTFKEALPLAYGLGMANEESHQLLGWILKWTSGHPYLTMRLCRAIAEQSRSKWTESDIDELVSKTFFGSKSEEDNNLQFVRDMLTKRAKDPIDVLRTYQQIIRSKKGIPDEEQSITKSHLKLSGVVCRRDGQLQVRNAIYREVFNERWVREHLPVNWKQRLVRVAAAMILLMVIIAAFLAPYAWSQKLIAEGETEKAREALDIAEERRLEAEKSNVIAEEQSAIAEAERIKAEARRVEAERQKGIAESKTKEAQQQRELAIKQSNIAKEARLKAEDRRVEAETQTRIAEEQSEIALAASEEAERQKQIAEKNSEEVKKLNAQLVEERVKALKERDEAEAIRLAFQADYLIRNETEQVQTGTLLAAEAMKQYPSLEAFQALRLGINKLPRILKLPKNEFSITNKRSVTSVAYNYDGSLIATLNADQVAQIADATGKTIWSIGGVIDLAFSPDGRLLVTAGPDGTVRILDVSTKRRAQNFFSDSNFKISQVSFMQSGKTQTQPPSDIPPQLQSFKHEKRVKAMAFSSDGKLIATAGNDNIAIVRDTYSGKILSQVSHDGQDVNALCFSLDGQLLATGSNDDTARIWEVASGRLITRLNHTGDVNAVAFSPNGQYLATASSDKSALIWEFRGVRPIARLPHQAGVEDIIFSPDGKYVATRSGNISRIWEVPVKITEVAIIPKSIDIKQTNLVTDITFSPEGRYLATACLDGKARLWDVNDGNQVATMNHKENTPVNAIAFSPKGEYLATAGGDGTARVWNLSTDQEVQPMKHPGAVQTAAFSPDGQFLATTSVNNIVKIWNTDNSTPRTDLSAGRSDKSRVNNAAFSPDGRWLVSASDDGKAYVWKTQNWEQVLVLRNPNSAAEGDPKNGLNSASFDSTGKRIVTARLDGSAQIWDAETGEVLAELKDNCSQDQCGILSAAFNTEGNIVGTLSEGGKINIWNVKKKIAMPISDENKGVFSTFAFSPDGKMLAAGSGDIITFWRVDTVSKISLDRSMIHPGGLRALAFSPDGKHLISSSSNNGTARVWELTLTSESSMKAREIIRVDHGGTPINGVAFSQVDNLNGKYFATAGNDSTARLWLWQTSDLITDICRRVTRPLREDEWQQYIFRLPFPRSEERTCPELTQPSGKFFGGGELRLTGKMQ